MELEKIAIVRADSGRLAVTVHVVTPETAERVIDQARAAQVEPGEDLEILRIVDGRLWGVVVPVQPRDADAIEALAQRERVL